MVASSTANYGFIKPDVGDSGWGPTVNSDLDAIDSAIHSLAGGGGGSGLPEATPLTTTLMTNAVAGGTMTVAVLPSDNVVFSFTKTGDAFPRFSIIADPLPSLYLGDGTVSLYDCAGISYEPDLQCISITRGDGTTGLRLGHDLRIESTSAGVILQSSGGNYYRITVADDGHLITTAV